MKNNGSLIVKNCFNLLDVLETSLDEQTLTVASPLFSVIAETHLRWSKELRCVAHYSLPENCQLNCEKSFSDGRTQKLDKKQEVSLKRWVKEMPFEDKLVQIFQSNY